MPLQDWPESERPREKLLKLGAASLSEAELLAILLQTGTTIAVVWCCRGCGAEVRW